MYIDRLNIQKNGDVYMSLDSIKDLLNSVTKEGTWEKDPKGGLIKK